MAKPAIILSYDTSRYPFRSIVEDILGEPLDTLDGTFDHLLTREEDQDTAYHHAFYQGCWDTMRFMVTYRRFVHEVICGNLPSNGLLYQTVPTFRVQLRNNVAVGEFHRDADYRHSLHELNYWVPLTHAWGTNTIHLEDPATGAKVPVPVHYGEYLAFPGARVRHGNVPNTTGATRVSFDFRILDKRYYDKVKDQKSISGVPFRVGEYWSEI